MTYNPGQREIRIDPSQSRVTIDYAHKWFLAQLDNSLKSGLTKQLEGVVTVKSVSVEDFAEGSETIAIKVVVDTLLMQCELNARVAVPRAMPKLITTRNVGSSAGCKSDSLAGINLMEQAESALYGLIEKNLNKRVEDFLKDWNKADPYWAKFMA